MLKRLVITMAACLIGVSAVSYAEEPAEKLELRNGGVLYVHPDGTSRMVDQHGKRVEMLSGSEMTLKDGRLVMMKNKTIWIGIGSPGDGHMGLKND